MIIKRVDPKGYSGVSDIVNNTRYVSPDSGKSWEYRGLVDSTHEKAVLAPRSVFSHEGTMYFGT